MEFYDMKIHTVKYSRCTGGNNGGAGAVQQRNPEPAAGRGGAEHKREDTGGAV